jgi:peptidoglycan/LPS O-acetylase OafA/YrhL
MPHATRFDARFDPRRNSLNALRLVLAALVIFSHAWPLGGFGSDPSPARQSLGHWAVLGFFAVSGYLIAASRARSGFGAFLAARVLRIYPAFLVCLILVAFVAAPLSTELTTGHWTAGAGASYVAHNALLKIEANTVGGTIPHVPYGPAWNGSLWTLFYEFLCYLLVGVLLSAPRRWHGPLVAAAFAVTAVGGQLTVHRTGTAADFLSLAPVFLAGSLLYLYADRIPVAWPYGVAALVLVPVAGQLNVVSSIGAPVIVYACFWLGIVLPLQKVGHRNDISYGVYIYAYPVQQLVAAAGWNRHGVALYILLSVLLTLPLAAASWFVVEHPALGLKKRLRRAAPGRVAAAEAVGVGGAVGSVGPAEAAEPLSAG